MPEQTRIRRLVVHIGDHKTGSTSIQYAFANGRVALDGRRLFLRPIRPEDEPILVEGFPSLSPEDVRRR